LNRLDEAGNSVAQVFFFRRGLFRPQVFVPVVSRVAHPEWECDELLSLAAGFQRMSL
jgi:hypothetical protein